MRLIINRTNAIYTEPPNIIYLLSPFSVSDCLTYYNIILVLRTYYNMYTITKKPPESGLA